MCNFTELRPFLLSNEGQRTTAKRQKQGGGGGGGGGLEHDEEACQSSERL